MSQLILRSIKPVRSLIGGAILLATGGILGTLLTSAKAAPDPAKNRVFEIRTYITAEGRLDALHKRFREHTNGLFVKHGMELVGYWTPTDGDAAKNTLVYILAHSSREAAKKSWSDFQADPDWKTARDESEKDGKIVDKVISQFLAPTDYSPIK